MRVHLGGAESVGRLRFTDLEFKPVMRARTESHAELPGCMTSQRSEADLFGDRVGIADWSGIGVASSHSHLSRLESMGVEHVAESQGSLGDRGHKEGSP